MAVEQTTLDPNCPEIPPHLRLSVVAEVLPISTGEAKGADSGADEDAASKRWYAPVAKVGDTLFGNGIATDKSV